MVCRLDIHELYPPVFASLLSILYRFWRNNTYYILLCQNLNLSPFAYYWRPLTFQFIQNIQPSLQKFVGRFKPKRLLSSTMWHGWACCTAHPIQRIAISNLSTFWCHSAEYVQGVMFDPSMAGDQEVYTATKHMKKVQNNANTDKDILPQ